MEDGEIYMNQEARMQAAASKDKQRGTPDNKKGIADPEYENITLTFRNRDQPKGCHSSPKNQVPTRSKPSSDSAQGPHWLHKALISLYILLALFCITLLVCVLVKNSEMSQELLALKTELLNVSSLTQACQEEQEQGWSKVQQGISDNRKHTDAVKSYVQTGNKKLEMLQADIGQIKTQLATISEKLQNIQTQKPPA